MVEANRGLREGLGFARSALSPIRAHFHLVLPTPKSQDEAKILPMST